MSTRYTIVSSKLYKYLRLMFSLGKFCHSHPYQWNEELGRGELCTSPWKLAVWNLNLGITIVYSIYLMGRGIQINLDEESSIVKKVYNKFVLFYYAFPVLFQATIWTKKDELGPFCHLNTTAIQVFENTISNQAAVKNDQVLLVQQENDNGDRPKTSSKCLMPKAVDFFFDAAWYGLWAILPLMGLLNLMRPQNPEFISSVLAPDSGTLRWLVIILSAIFQVYYEFMQVGNALFFVIGGFGSGISTIITLVWIRNRLLIKSTRIPTATVEGILDLYRSVEIIIKVFESSLCDLLVPGVKGISIGVCVFCAYGAIKMEGFLVIVLGTVGLLIFGILVAMLSMVAMFDTLSRKILQLMKEPRFQNSLTPGQKKEVKSLHPIQLRMRRGYILDKECVKTVYRIIVEATLNLLLAKF